jgi:hypothetical protein
MWCPAPLPKGEQHWRKLRSDKYKPPAGRLLEFYESDSSVEADEDTDDEAGDDDAGTGPDTGGAAKSRRRTKSTMGKKLASAVAAAVSAVKAAEQKKKRRRKRRAACPPVMVTPAIPIPRLQEVKSKEDDEEEKVKDEAIEELPVTKDRQSSRSENPTAKRQRELVEKTSEDALRRGLDAQRAVVAAQVRMTMTIRPRVFKLKAQIPAVVR